MVELIDVSKWFSSDLRLNPDLIESICRTATIDEKNHGFEVKMFSGEEWSSVDYQDKKIASYEMDQFCKKLQGDI